MHKEKKEKLIELILIIGSILVALKIPETNLMFDGNIITKGFMFVILFSIVYFIIIQQEPKKLASKRLINFLGVSISMFFSMILASILVFANVISAPLTLIQNILFFIIVFLYWIFFTIVLFGALREK